MSDDYSFYSEHNLAEVLANHPADLLHLERRVVSRGSRRSASATRRQLETGLDASGATCGAVKNRERVRREAAIDAHFREYERRPRDSSRRRRSPIMQILTVLTGDAGEPLRSVRG